jgi:hypothetical protein
MKGDTSYVGNTANFARTIKIAAAILADFNDGVVVLARDLRPNRYQLLMVANQGTSPSPNCFTWHMTNSPSCNLSWFARNYAFAGIVWQTLS